VGGRYTKPQLLLQVPRNLFWFVYSHKTPLEMGKQKLARLVAAADLLDKYMGRDEKSNTDLSVWAAKLETTEDYNCKMVAMRLRNPIAVQKTNPPTEVCSNCYVFLFNIIMIPKLCAVESNELTGNCDDDKASADATLCVQCWIKKMENYKEDPTAHIRAVMEEEREVTFSINAAESALIAYFPATVFASNEKVREIIDRSRRVRQTQGEN
jgi:hypothetical protein